MDAAALHGHSEHPELLLRQVQDSHAGARLPNPSVQVISDSGRVPVHAVEDVLGELNGFVIRENPSGILPLDPEEPAGFEEDARGSDIGEAEALIEDGSLFGLTLL